MMHDYVASFYGGYDQVALRRTAAARIPRVAMALAVAGVALLVLVAADVAAYENRPAVVRVTEVDWYAEGILLTTEGGFSVAASSVLTFPLVCSSVCFPWVGAIVAAPFLLVNFTVEYATAQYTNVTVKAPSGAYTGSLSIDLEWS